MSDSDSRADLIQEIEARVEARPLSLGMLEQVADRIDQLALQFLYHGYPSQDALDLIARRPIQAEIKHDSGWNVAQ